MNQEEFINFLKPKVITALLPQKDQEAVLRFLTGETNKLPKLPEIKTTFYFYEFLDVITGQFHGKAEDTAKRAYYYLTKLCPDKLISQNLYRNNIYQVYFEAGVEESFVIRDIIKRIQNYLGGYNWRYLKELEETKKAMLENRPASKLIGEAFLYYGDMLKRLTLEKKPTLLKRLTSEKKPALKEWPGRETPEALTLNALSVFWYRQEPEQQQVFLLETEKGIYSMIKSLYGKETEEIRQQMLSEETEKQFQMADKISMVTDKDMSFKITFAICCLLKEESRSLKELLRFLFAVSAPAAYYHSLDQTVEQLHLFLEDLEMPPETHIRLACAGIYLDGLEKAGEAEGNRLIEYYKKDALLWMDTMQKLKEPDFFPAYAVLYREKKEKKLQTEARKKYLLYLKKKEDKQVFQFFYAKKKDSLIQFLKEETEAGEAEIVFELRNREIKLEIVYTTFLLYDTLEEARKVAALLLKQSYQQNNGSLLLNVYIAQQKGFFPNSDAVLQESYLLSLYEKLADTIGVKLLLRLFAEGGNKSHTALFLQLAEKHLEDAAVVLEEVIESQDGSVIDYVDLFYSKDIGLSYETLGRVMEHKLKSVVHYMESFLADKELQTRPYIEKLKKSKNKNAKEAAERLLKLWDTDKTAELLSKITEKEELAKYISLNYEKSHKKKIPFAELLDFDSVHYQGTEEKAEAEILEYYISEYMLLKKPQKIQTCEKIREFLDENDLRIFTKRLYEYWLEKAADTKYKNLLLPYLISANTSDIAEFKKQLDTWTENSRGALAAFGVSVMAFNSMNITLLLIDAISKKYKNKQVKEAAQNAIEAAADLLGISKEALGDKIVPDLGFNQNRERWFDFGPRKFKGILSEKLQVFVYDASGKQLKNLPKPGAKDDKELAEEACQAFKDLKKQLKTVVANQKIRLEEAIMTGRKWEKTDWEQLFVHNPVMNGFAIGLIWEERSPDGTITGTFRYMEDGSFNSEEEEEYELSEQSEIMLLHPLDVSEELIEKWKEQLEDYEIEQPVNQLSMPVFRLSSDELKDKAVNRFEGKQVYFGTIRSVMDKYGWQKTSIVDAGGYEGYYYEDSASNIGVQMLFDFVYVGISADELVTIKTLEFYQKGRIEYGSYLYDEINDQNRILPKDVPEKLMSFALMAGEQIASKSL